MVEKMLNKSYYIFIFLFSLVLILEPSIAFLAENNINDKEFQEFVDKGLNDLKKIDTEKSIRMTKAVLTKFAGHLRELGYTVEASDEFIDKKIDEFYNSIKGQKFSNKDLKDLMAASSKTFEDFIRYAAISNDRENSQKNEDYYKSDEFYKNILDTFLINLNTQKDIEQVSAPTTGLAAPITIAFGMVRAIFGGLAGAGALGSGLLAAVITAVDFGLSIIPIIFCAILVGLVLGVLGLFAGGIIGAILAGLIGFFIPTLLLIALIMFILFITVGAGLGVGLSTIFSGIISLISPEATLISLIVSFITAFLPLIAIGIAIIAIVGGVVLLPVALLLGIPTALLSVPIGFVTGSLAAPLFAFVGGAIIGGVGGIVITQMAFLPLIAFAGLFTFVLGTAAYMAIGPTIGSTNDYLKPMSKGMYSIYLKYEKMDSVQFVVNIKQLLNDVLDVAKKTFGPKMYNTIKSLEIIVDTTDFTDADDIGRAAEETLNILTVIAH